MISLLYLKLLLLVLLNVLHWFPAAAAADGMTQTKRYDKDPSPYPERFSVQFATNITAHDWSEPLYSWLYYDWTQRAQRIEHTAGSYECQIFYNVTTGCTLIFLEEGMYRILNDDDDDNHPSSGDCCLDLPNIGVPPPDWASSAPSTWKGLRVDEFSGMMAYEWWFDKGSSGQSLGRHHAEDRVAESDTLPFHTMRQVAMGHEATYPLLFSFPGKAEGRQDMHFLPHTMIPSIPPGNFLFTVPDECRLKRCAQKSGLTSIVE